MGPPRTWYDVDESVLVFVAWQLANVVGQRESFRDFLEKKTHTASWTGGAFWEVDTKTNTHVIIANINSQVICTAYFDDIHTQIVGYFVHFPEHPQLMSFLRTISLLLNLPHIPLPREPNTLSATNILDMSVYFTRFSDRFPAHHPRAR